MPHWCPEARLPAKPRELLEPYLRLAGNEDITAALIAPMLGMGWRAMKDDMFTMMLAVVFAGVMVIAGQVLLDPRKQTEAAAFFDRLAKSPATAWSTTVGQVTDTVVIR